MEPLAMAKDHIVHLAHPGRVGMTSCGLDELEMRDGDTWTMDWSEHTCRDCTLSQYGRDAEEAR